MLMSGCSHTTYSKDCLISIELPLLYTNIVKEYLTIFVCLFLDFLFCSTDLSVLSPIPHCLHYKQYTQEVKFNGEIVFASFLPSKYFNKYFGVKKIFFNVNKFVYSRNRKTKRKREESQFPFVVLSINGIKGLKS